MTSEPFATSSRQYLHQLAAEWLSRHWLSLTLPLAAVLVWAAFDTRALYVLLIVIFLLYPMGLTLVWFNYALSPRSLRAITPKRLTLLEAGIQLAYSPKDIETDPRPAFRSEDFPWESISAAEVSAASITLIIGPRLDDRLNIPLSALDEEMQKELLKIIDRKFPADMS
ncbi:MAG: hypothetical protein K2J12_00055 [Muribaculaceae bacterium]|nr:hypothetical protein [Muribaculaceae bacterium]